MGVFLDHARSTSQGVGAPAPLPPIFWDLILRPTNFCMAIQLSFQIYYYSTSRLLSPCLFNVYINDLPSTCSRKFIYADDICLAAQRHTFGEVEDILNRDLEKMATFFGRLRLQPSSSKTVCCVFHLHNARANQKLNLLLSGQQIRHEPNPVYLGVTMDRSLTFRSQTQWNSALELTFLASWRDLHGAHTAQASTLRTSALASATL